MTDWSKLRQKSLEAIEVQEGRINPLQLKKSIKV